MKCVIRNAPPASHALSLQLAPIDETPSCRNRDFEDARRQLDRVPFPLRLDDDLAGGIATEARPVKALVAVGVEAHLHPLFSGTDSTIPPRLSTLENHAEVSTSTALS